MSNIALIGATGNIGSRVLAEALSRKHTVTAITRDPRKVSARPGMVIRAGSTTDAPALVNILKGHDIVVVSVKWNENDVRRVIDTIRKSGVKRALFVVGAGSLLRKNGKRHYDYMSEKGVQPPTSLPALQAYEEILKIDDLDLDGDLAAGLDPGRPAHRQVQAGARQADRERQGREPHQPRGFCRSHRRRDREAQARPQAVHGRVLERRAFFPLPDSGKGKVPSSYEGDGVMGHSLRLPILRGGWAFPQFAHHGLPDRGLPGPLLLVDTMA